MRYNIISYLIGEGFKNTLKNKKSTIASITTMCLTMLMFGAFFIIGENVNHIVKNIEQQQGMKIYLNEDVTNEQIQEIEDKIRNIEGVNTLEFVSREEEYNQMKEDWKDYPIIMEGVTVDRMDNSFILTLTDLSYNQSVQDKVNEIAQGSVKEIVNENHTIEMLQSISDGLRLGILVILAALIIISVFIISNTIKLTVHARRKEISIMKYVGATNSFIRWPFAVEGVIIGVISALVTIVIVGVAYNLIATQVVQAKVWENLNVSLVTFNEMIKLLLITYLSMGIGIGVIGSSISMRKYLEV